MLNEREKKLAQELAQSQQFQPTAEDKQRIKRSVLRHAKSDPERKLMINRLRFFEAQDQRS